MCAERLSTLGTLEPLGKPLLHQVLGQDKLRQLVQSNPDMVSHGTAHGLHAVEPKAVLSRIWIAGRGAAAIYGAGVMSLIPSVGAQHDGHYRERDILERAARNSERTSRRRRLAC
jgi:hypothetical protein